MSGLFKMLEMCCAPSGLTDSLFSPSDKQAIARACKAVEALHGMTSRIPQLMQQSHLESSEGMRSKRPFCSID